MFSQKAKIAALMAGISGFAAQISADTVKEKVRDAADTVRTTVYDITDKNSVQMNFDKGSSNLSDLQKSQLKATFNAASSDGKLKEIVITAYADKDYPKGKDEKLSAKDVDLAKKRARAVEGELNALGARNVRAFNMAEKATWFEKKLVTSDAQVKHEAKDTVGSVSRDDDFYQDLGRHLETAGGPSKAIVVFRHEGSRTAH